MCESEQENRKKKKKVGVGQDGTQLSPELWLSLNNGFLSGETSLFPEDTHIQHTNGHF